jgi:hypothetical protein
VPSKKEKIPNTKEGWWSDSSGRMPASKHKALSSNPSSNTKKKKKKQQTQ